MNKALIKSQTTIINEAWHDLTVNLMDKCWTIGVALVKIKAELPAETKWAEWCEENLHLSYGHVARFLQIGNLPKKPEMPKLASNAKFIPDLSIEKLALAAGRVKKGTDQERAINEIFFPPPPARIIRASDEEPVVVNTAPVVPLATTKKKAKEVLTRPLALDIIGIVSDDEAVDVFVNRTTLEVIFEGLEVKWKGDAKKLNALKTARMVLL